MTRNERERIDFDLESAFESAAEVVEREYAHQRLESRVQTMSALSAALLSTQSVAEISAVALAHLPQLIPYNHITIYSYDTQRQMATVLAVDAPEDSPFTLTQEMPFNWQNHQIASHGPTIHYVSNLNSATRCLELCQMLAGEGITSLILALLVYENEVLGALQIGSTAAEAYQQEHLDSVYETAELLLAAFHQNNLRNKLHLYTHTLETSVQERTTALEQANRELRRANQLKDAFLANMSHELRTPLADVLTKAELLQAGYYGSLNERQKSELQKIESGGLQLLRLIGDIFDLAQAETEQLKLHFEPVSIWEVCEVSLQSIWEAAQKKNLRIEELQIDQKEVVEADVSRLKQMLEILLSNAVKFNSTGGRITLEAVVLPADTSERWVQFAVTDTGIGIAPEHLEKIFVPFVQLDEGLARRFEGLGLGLALCSRLARLHNGRCRVESILGEGSRFIIELPLRQFVEGND